MDEEITDLMTIVVADEVSQDGEICVGTNLAQFTGYEFSAPNATTAWMRWDAKGSH